MDIYEALGLTDGERKVYGALVALKSSTTGPIYRFSKVSQSKVYEILYRLKEKGLVSFIEKNGATFWQPADPQIYLDKISDEVLRVQKKKEVLETELPKLLKTKTFDTEDVSVFEDFNGFRNALLSFQESFTSKDELLVFSSPNVIPQPYLAFLQSYTVERLQRKIYARIIFGKGFASTHHGEKLTKTIRADIIMPSTIAISSDRVILMTWNQKPKFIVMRGKDISRSYSSFFESFWKIAKK